MEALTDTAAAPAGLSPQRIRLIRSSWQALAPAGTEVGRLFYQRLFEIAPGLRPLFAPDLEPQSRKLIAMLGLVVEGLDRLPTLLPAVAALGRRHIGYGVRPAHYDNVGQALLWTLERGLGPTTSDEVIAAWAAAYGTLAAVMQQPDGLDAGA